MSYMNKTIKQDVLVAEGESVPVMSGNSVGFILEKLNKEKFPFVVEYGSGNSTLFFLKELAHKNITCTFVSVEYNYNWFMHVCHLVKDTFATSLRNEKTELTPWSPHEIKSYLHSPNQTTLEISPEYLRLGAAKARLRDLRWNWIKNILRFFLGKKRYPQLKPYNGYFSATIGSRGDITFLYFLWSEFMKDQYGESPFKNNYIDVGIAPIREYLEKTKKPARALFIVDGGPRADILDTIFELEDSYPHFYPTILLFEAHRLFYQKTLKKRPTGKFVAGSNVTLNGRKIYKGMSHKGLKDVWGIMTAEEMAEKEMWFYSRSNHE